MERPPRGSGIRAAVDPHEYEDQMDVNETTIECPACKGAGDLPERKQVERVVADLLSLGASGLPGKATWVPAMADLTGGLAGRPPRAWGHDALDRGEATDKIIRAAGLDPRVWGICHTCKGEGELPADG